MAWASPEKNLGTGGLEGWPRRRRIGGGEWFRGGQGGAPTVTGGGEQGVGRWWLAARGEGVEFDDKLEALDFVSNGWKI